MNSYSNPDGTDNRTGSNISAVTHRKDGRRKNRSMKITTNDRKA